MAGAVSLFVHPASAFARQTFRENEIKATYLFNFAQFVTWPSEAFANPRAPIVIGVLGDDPFGPVLDDLLKDEAVGQRPLIARRYRRVQDAAAANVLFINLPGTRATSAALAALRGKPVLTVGDADDFCQNGGMIRFIAAQRNIRFQINPAAARQAGLTISSRVLQLAEIFQGPGPR